MHKLFRTISLMALVAVAPLCLARAGAQILLADNVAPAVSTSNAAAATESLATSSTALPEAPTPVISPSALAYALPDTAKTSAAAKRSAPRYAKYIAPGETAQSITSHDKLIIGLRDSVSLTSVAGWFVVAGYEQVQNGSPNYGTDRGAFGERLGAAAVRDICEGVFTDFVFASALHQDPRYYIEGPRHNFVHRLVYAGTRPLITRTDSGRSTINASMILGNAAGSALSYAYYPSVNRNFTETARTFGTSFGGDALGYVVSEFSADVIGFLHHRHN